jgi:LPS export ABC transporter protein LptC
MMHSPWVFGRNFKKRWTVRFLPPGRCRKGFNEITYIADNPSLPLHSQPHPSPWEGILAAIAIFRTRVIHSLAKKRSIFYLPAALICMLLLNSCENSLDDIKKISSDEQNKPISRSTGVDVIYSDSAKVKAHMTTPLMIEYGDANKPYHEMTKGIKIVFYDDDLKEKGTITSDYAIQREKENIIEFRKNVVATNAQGETFKSEELIDDQTNKKLYSTKAVQITMANGNVMNGTGFHSNESLYPWNIDHSTGIFNVTENPGAAKK